MNKKIYDIENCTKSAIFLTSNGSVLGIKASSMLGYYGDKKSPLVIFTNIKGYESISIYKTSKNIERLVQFTASV